MVESIFFGQPGRVKIRSLGKGLFGLLIFLWKGFWPKGLFGKHFLRLILAALFFLIKMNFAKQTPNKIPKLFKTNLKLFRGPSHLFPMFLLNIGTVYLHYRM